METRQSNTSKIVVGIVIVLIIAIGIWYVRKDTVPPVTAPVVVQAYKDGTYAATGMYTSPAGKEEVGVSLTLKDNVITDVTFTPKATNEVSIKLQGMFASGFKELVVGKDINTVKLDKVSGSSLTPKGFNDALDKIRLEAQA